MQVNRSIKGNPALDAVDHALGRPYRTDKTNRDHFATSDPDEIKEMIATGWWIDCGEKFETRYLRVSDAGRKALAFELAKPEYGRLFSITSKRYDGETFVMAKSHSAAKYEAYVNADLDWSFMEYCKEISVRLAA